MITEDYVSFEIAKLLKEKGFDEQTRDFYRFENNIWIHRNTYEYNHFNLGMPRWENCYACPTLQMAMKWLREIHNIAINIGWGEVFEDKFQWWCIILNIKDGSILRESEYYATYEQACEAAIKYCLENLVNKKESNH